MPAKMPPTELRGSGKPPANIKSLTRLISINPKTGKVTYKDKQSMLEAKRRKDDPSSITITKEAFELLSKIDQSEITDRRKRITKSAIKKVTELQKFKSVEVSFIGSDKQGSDWAAFSAITNAAKSHRELFPEDEKVYFLLPTGQKILGKRLARLTGLSEFKELPKKMTEHPTEIDWSRWKSVENLSLFEIAALMHGVDPRKIPISDRYFKATKDPVMREGIAELQEILGDLLQKEPFSDGFPVADIGRKFLGRRRHVATGFAWQLISWLSKPSSLPSEESKINLEQVTGISSKENKLLLPKEYSTVDPENQELNLFCRRVNDCILKASQSEYEENRLLLDFDLLETFPNSSYLIPGSAVKHIKSILSKKDSKRTTPNVWVTRIKELGSLRTRLKKTKQRYPEYHELKQ